MSTDYLHNIYCPQLRTRLAGVSGGQEAIVDEFVSQLETGEWLGVQLSSWPVTADYQHNLSRCLEPGTQCLHQEKQLVVSTNLSIPTPFLDSVDCYRSGHSSGMDGEMLYSARLQCCVGCSRSLPLAS